MLPKAINWINRLVIFFTIKRWVPFVNNILKLRFSYFIKSAHLVLPYFDYRLVIILRLLRGLPVLALYYHPAMKALRLLLIVGCWFRHHPLPHLHCSAPLGWRPPLDSLAYLRWLAAVAEFNPLRRGLNHLGAVVFHPILPARYPSFSN